MRRALNYAFDFETLKRTLFYGQYERINSFFYGTPLASSGLPEGTELEILQTRQGQGAAGGFHDTLHQSGRRRPAEGAREPAPSAEAAAGGRLPSARARSSSIRAASSSPSS